MLRFENAGYSVGGKLLLLDANVSINPGDRIGIVGRNGCGKTQLMNLFSGGTKLDAGSRKVRNGVKVLLVKQELPNEDESPLDYLQSHDEELQALNASLKSAPISEIGNINDQIIEIEEGRYQILAPKILLGLGLSEEELTRPMRFLSGGLRMRIGLSMALVRMPDILLLDEPTNHLDLESTQWLIRFLKNYPKSSAFVVVTHDIQLLTEVTTSTMHLRSAILTQYTGDFLSYRAQLTLKETQDEHKNETLEKEIQKKMEIYYKFRDLPEARAAQAKDQLRKANILKNEKIEIPTEEPVISFTFPEAPDLSNPIIDLKEVKMGYGDKILFKNLNLSIQHGTKIGLLGCNGQGKTSLIKLLVGKIKPLSGQLDARPKLKIGYFSQELTDELDVALTIYQQFQKMTGITNEAHTRQQLGKFGFPWEKVSTCIENLSGGEKSRLMFALICSSSPNMIILDEPTNHLDIETREVLTNAIKNFKGTVILVSHDWDLHKQTMEQFWIADKGCVQAYQGGLEHYKKKLLINIEKNLNFGESCSDHNNSPKPVKKSKETKGSSVANHPAAHFTQPITPIVQANQTGKKTPQKMANRGGRK